MIFLKDGVWLVHSFKATFIDSSSGDEKVVEEFTSNREELERRVANWAHFYRLSIEEVKINGLQQARLEEINGMDLHIGYETPINTYVRYGYVDPTFDFPEDSAHSEEFEALAHKPEVISNRKSYLTTLQAENIAKKRWLLECGGVRVNGMSFGTSDREKTLLNGKVLSAQANPKDSYNFKVYEGWVKLTPQQVIDIGLAVDDFVQACFDREEQLSMQLMDAVNPLEVDIESGWPSREITV